MASAQKTNKDANKKDKVSDSLRDEMELVAAASAELQKLKRQLRQTRSELSNIKVSNARVIKRQEKSIELLEKEKTSCEQKLIVITFGQRPPSIVDLYIAKYKSTQEQLLNFNEQLRLAREELKDKQDRLNNPQKNADGKPVGHHVRKIENGIMDHVTLQYNKILANNTKLRAQLEEMVKVKEEFIRTFKQLQIERGQVRTIVERLYEENTILFQQREEYRMKLNLLKEKLETTRIQGQRDLREYRRLLNNDEKLNAFLERKNQDRPHLQIDSRLSAPQVCYDHLAWKMIREWREVLLSYCGHANFEETIQQYLHNLEQGYVMYGLIAQKNQEIDKLEDDIGALEKNVERMRCRTNVHDPSQQKTQKAKVDRNQNEKFAGIHVLVKFQGIVDAVGVSVNIITDSQQLSSLDALTAMGLCKMATELLANKISNLVSTVTSTNLISEDAQHWDPTGVPSLTSLRSNNSIESGNCTTATKD